MDQRVKPAPHEIVRARIENPKMRERDLAAQLGISEAELTAAHCGDGVVRIEPRVRDLLNGLGAVGEVMALTRNDSVVHEKIGVYENVSVGDNSGVVLGEQIDLRVFPKLWAHGFAVEKRDGDETRRSLQFFDRHGDAVHKVHLRPASNLPAYDNLVASLLSDDQSRSVEVFAPAAASLDADAAGTREELRDRWSSLTDVHQFFGMLRALKLDRRQAVRMVGDDFAWRLRESSVVDMMHAAAARAVPIMCFVASRGCVQIHAGPIASLKPMGPWLNVMDETFHLHFRTDHVAEAWGVRRPTRDGHVTSVEAYDAAGNLIIQFFGKRHEGEAERADWRALAEGLPRADAPIAA